jgi:microcompartment protein CcmL/EutN
MNNFKFDLILSGLRHVDEHVLARVHQELEKVGCTNPRLRRDKEGLRMSVETQAMSMTQAIYAATQRVSAAEGFSLSVRSIEFGKG